jgi:hypothetical protein
MLECLSARQAVARLKLLTLLLLVQDERGGSAGRADASTDGTAQPRPALVLAYGAEHVS